jgi:formylglycine-generating enzyme required for sulfatase activity
MKLPQLSQCPRLPHSTGWVRLFSGGFDRWVGMLTVWLCAFALFAVGAVGSVPSSPVSDVTFAQRTDGSKIVDVRYTLSGGSSGIALAYSVDGGTTYSAISSATGDVGTMISAGTSKQIVWNAVTEAPNVSSANVRFRVTPLLGGAGGSFAPVPGGTYSLGNVIGDPEFADPGTVSVSLSPYYVSVNDTTKEQWDSLRAWATSNGYADLAQGGGKAASHPVHSVTWYDVVKWANAASEGEGLTPCYKSNGAVYRSGRNDSVACDWTANGYRLPTEAEWEVAARGGLNGKRYPWGDTISHRQANYKAGSNYAFDLSGAINDWHPMYKAGSGPYTSPVGSFVANGYGLYDMAGNINQWCWDWYGTRVGGVDPRGIASGSNRVLRGGGWNDTPYHAKSGTRIANRPSFEMTSNGASLGFRLAKGRSDGAGSAAFSPLGALDTAPPPPTSPVSNVTFAQRTDGSKLVDVRYTLTGGSVGIALALSVDGGTTYSALSSVTGDVGAMVSAGTSKQIVWNAGTDYPNTSFANVKFRVTPLISGAGGSFAPIPSGTYSMGNLVGDADITDAGTVSVTLSPYSMSVNDTTKAQWDAVRTWASANGYTDLPEGGGKAANHPVHSVSWYDSIKWANAVSEKEGLTPCYKINGAVFRTGTSSAVTCDWHASGYRLPTEAEWQIAARGGLKGKRFPWGDTISHSQANYAATSSVTYDRSGAVNDYHPAYKTGVRPFTSSVESFAPNGYGLFGVAGEVFRWCWDWYGVQYSGGLDPRGPASGTTRIRLGGSWFVSPEYARSARRHALDPVAALDDYGFRLARNRFDASGSAAFSALGALNTKPPAPLLQDITPQVTGLTGYSSAWMREVANSNGAAPYYLSTDSDVLKLYAQPAPFQFTDVSAKVLPAGYKWAPGSRLLVADFDNNGSQDLVLWEPTGLRVLLNTAGTFREAPVPAALNPRLAEIQKTLLDVTAADLDGDGDLDLVFRYTALNTPKPGRVACVYNDAVRSAEGRQSWAPNAAGFARVEDVMSLSYGYGGLFTADLNLDGKVDLIVGEKLSTSVNDNYQQRPLHFFVNQGAGVFEESGAPLQGMADYQFAFADYQGTGRLDLIQGSSDWPWSGSYPHAYWSSESGVFEKSSGPVLERVSGDYHFVLSTADFDLDGRSDAFWTRLGRYFGGLSTGPLRMWRTTGPKTFQDVSSNWGFVFKYPAGSRDYVSTVADFDDDGSPDLLVNAAPWDGSTLRLYRNNAVKTGSNYLKVRLTGVASARDGTGARIEVRTGSAVTVRYQFATDHYGAQPNGNLPFGLGAAKTADLVKVYWPSGKVSEVKNVPGNQWLEVVEPSAAQFEVIRGRFTWPEALADAAKRGGRPAVLSTPELLRQANALQVGADAVSLWIGLSDEAVNGTFRWIDESPSTGFTNWSTSEPNDFFGPASENNVEMYANGKWNDLPGTFPLPGYLFERTGGTLRITKQPESVSVNFAAPFSLSVTAVGGTNITYRWFKDGQEILGATSGTLSVSALTRSGVGTYWAFVSEAGKSLTSEKALVTMANPPPVPTDALLAWWPLDGNAIDQGPNAIHGTLTGPTAGIDRYNRVTRTLEFAGSRNSNAFVDFGAADKLRVSGDSTVAHWVRFSDSDTPTPRILQFGAGQFELSTTTGRGPRAIQYTVGGVTLKGARLLETGKWHHIAAVRKAGRGFLYVNGRLDAEGPLFAAPAFGKTLNLGRNAALSDGAFAGALDDLRIYGRALTSLEIEALVSQPDGGDILPPVIVQDPKSLLVDAGAAAQFVVRASGSRGLLYYQWLKDGMELPGATAAVLTLPKVEARHTGAYSCVVSDGYAKVTSASATLGVNGVNAGLWQGLVGHWKLDGNGLDSSGFANHATMRGTPAVAADRFGVGTGAFSFGGNGAYFEVGDRAAFDLDKSDATLSAWVKTASAAEGWLLSKMDPSKAGGIGIGAGAAASLSSKPVTYFKLSHDHSYHAYQRIRSVAGVNLVTGNVYEVTAVFPADFVWSWCVFEFFPSWYNPPPSGVQEPISPSSQWTATKLVGNHVEFRYRFKSLNTAAGQHPQFAFYRGTRQLVEIGNIELKNITTGELLTPPLDSPTLATQWTWDSVETVKHRTATIGAAGSPTVGASTMLWGNGASSAKRSSDSAQLGDNKWHLVTAVYDRKGKMRLYVDGAKRVETDLTPADIQVTNEHPLLIGSAVGAQSVTGTLDDVRWYNRALSDADVSALYRQNEVVDTDGDGLSDAYEYGWGRYELVRGSYTWAEAKAHAEARGGHLATITSEAEWQAIKTVVGPAVTNTTLWLGGTDEGSEGRWRWLTGEKWGFAKWGRNPGWGQEPNGATGENTLMLWTDPSYVDRPNGFIWNDSNNVVRWGYLFERGYFTDGTKWDTDGDGVSDSDEIKNGTDPTNPDSGLASTYKVIEGKYTWHEAKADAEARGGHLVTVTSQGEWALIKTLIGLRNTTLWMGGSDARVEGTWEWVTGEKWDFSAWGGPDPNGGAFENYTLLFPGFDSNGSFVVGDDLNSEKVPDGTEIHWVDIQPNHRFGYILEIEPTVRNQYSVVEGRFTWKEAKADAEKRGGHLVTVASAAEWDTIRLALGDKFDKLDLWMGATDELVEGQWKWVTGEPFNYQLWCTGEPNGSGSYMHKWVRGGNKWDDVPNSHNTTGECVGYILEIERTAADLNLAITTQPAPVTVPAIGGTASFSVAATGLAPLTYQWRKDGVALPGAEQSTLSLKNVSPAQIGKYTVVVGDASGKTVTSNEAALAITGVNSEIWGGLFAYYPFNGNANDESGSGLHGTVMGGSLSTDRFGKASGYTFPRVGNKIRLPLDHTRFAADFTLALWVNVADFLNNYPSFASGENSFLVFHGAGPVYAEAFRNKAAFYQNDRSLSMTDRVGELFSSSLMSFGNWVQLTMVRSGNTHTLYVNGTQDQTKTSTSAIKTSGDVLYLGGSYLANTEDFRLHGSIDDVRVYNRALSAAEVKALYDAEKAIPPLITKQPVGMRMPPGSSGVLQVEATGDTPLAYQWQKDGVNITGGTAQQLPLNNVTEALQGSYRVRVSNGAGSVFSEAVLVDVLDPVSNVTVYVAKNGSDTTGDGTQAKPFVTIGKAVKAAAAGARILVGPGTYAERVEYAGKSLRIHSSEGPASTVLQGAAGNTVVYIDAAATNAELRGFKITGGTGRPSPSSYGSDYYGGGLHCATSALISDCIFEGNGKGTPRVNSATFGGAIYSNGGKLQVVNCLIHDNFAWACGGASLTESGSIEFDRCTVYGNDATQFFGRQGGLAVANGGRMLVRNCIVWGNTGSQLGAFGWPHNVGTEIVVEYSDIQSPNDGGGAQTFRNGTGNISNDPLFADAAAKNFALRTGSPALDKAAPGLPKETDGTAADMGWRADRFGGEAVTFGSQLFTDVTESVRLPQHELLAEVDAGQGRATDRLVRVADGTLQLWRVTGAFGYRDVTLAAGLPKDLLAPGFGGFYAVGDVDNNGAQDLVVWDASGLRVFVNTAGAFKASVVSPAVNSRAVSLFPKARGTFTLADLDGDGDLDAVFNYEDAGEDPGRIAQFTNGATPDGTSGRRVWMANDGFSGVQDVMTFPWQKPHFSVTDSNADGLPDLVVLETNGSWPSDTHVSHKAHVYLNNIGGNGRSQPTLNLLRELPPGMKLIPAGEFQMGDSLDGNAAEPVHSVSLSPYFVGTTLVSARELKSVADWAVQNGYSFKYLTGWDGPSMPATNFNWWDAVKWCNAKSEMEGRKPCYYTSKAKTSATVFKTGEVDISNEMVDWTCNGYRLLTEAEWEKAARGGLQSKRFPWGDFISHTDANYSSSGDLPYDTSVTRGYHPEFKGNAGPLNSFKPNGYGLYGMAGSVSSWCWDWGNSLPASAVVDPKGPLTGTYKVTRGGTALDWAVPLRVSASIGVMPKWGGTYIGFRLAVSATGANSGDITSRYAVISGSYTFAEAQADAVARGGHLLTVSKAREWDAVLDELTGRATSEDFWLGAEYDNTQWGWVTGEGFDYTNWDGGTSGSGTAGVYSAKDTGKWKTAAAGARMGYLLEWEPAFQEVEEAGLTDASEFSNFLSIDVDGDGLLDLVNGSSDWPAQSSPKVFYGNGDGTYRQAKAPFVGSDRFYHHVARVADIDLDGRMDGWWSGLHNFSDLQARLWRGIGGGAFAEVGTEWGVDVGLPSGNLFLSGYLSDWDGDGDLDLVANASGSGAGRYKVYRNNAADRGGRWLRIRLVGVESPRDGTGARVTVVSGDRSETQYVGNLSSDGSPVATQLLFGLGSAPAASQIVVTWPNGQLQYLNNIPAGQVVEISQNTVVPDWLKFTEQPVGRTVSTGTLVVFSATAVGSGTISYQWFKDGAPITGGTGSSFRIAAAALTSVGDYQVVATNGVAKAASAVARLEVAVPPSIVAQPVSVSVVAGTDVSFSVDAIGTAPLTYQWSKGTVAVTGATGRTLQLKGVGAADVASYSVKVTNPAGSVTSTAAALTLLTPVQITKQPANLTVIEGAPIGLSVTATGSPVLKYQWYKDSNVIVGGTTAALAVTKASALDAGSYSVSVSNPAGETSSTAAVVVVNLLPRVLNVEENLSVKEGTAFTLVAEATGTAPLGYVWKKDGTLVAGQTTATLSVSAATLADSGVYTVEVKNAVGLAVARVATVSVQELPRIVTQPVGIDAVEGSSAVLSVAATGAQPLSYQWYKDGTAMEGQTSAVLSLSPLSATTHSGTYKVQVSNTVGRIFSDTAVVSARPVLRITTQPASVELAVGVRGTLSVVASGPAPLSYQWFKDGATLPFATDDTLFIASVGKYSIGDYTVLVKDRFGNAVRSEVAALTVAGEPSTYWKGLMAHWKFSGDTRDGTPFLNHGKGSNVQTIADRFGIANSALRFSGKLNPLAKPLVSQNVTVSHSDSLQPSDKYTVVVWAKPEFAGENLAEVSPFMLGKRAGGDLRDVSYAVGAGFGSGALDRINGGGVQTGYVTGGTATLVNGQWQMYALTFDGGSLTLYRNGAKAAVQAASASAAAPNTGPLRLGSGSGDGYQEWFGCLDDIRLYNKVLSAEQVAELYTEENTPPEGAVAPAAIVVQPVGYKVPEGAAVTLRVEASGGAPLAYQWKRDGAVLTGATSAEYKIASAVLADEGSYTVEVSNSVASVTSVPAFVDVVPAVVADRLHVAKTGNDTTGTGASSAPFLTIAKAVQAARSGFQIQVGPGTYAERVEYRGKTLVIESSAGPLETVIQAPAGNTAVFIDAAAVNSELRGFKIAGGTGRALSATATSITFIGGGVCILTSALVQDCIIEENGNAAGIRFKSQASFGGGVYSTGGTTQLVNCLIIGNHASEAGGAVFTERGTCELDRCTVYGNTVGMLNAQIGGLGVRDSGRLVVRNSIVRGNTGQQIGAQPFPYNRGTSVTIEYSAIEGGAVASQVATLKAGAGNISGDPLFADVAAKNFALRAGSPALDAAAPGLPKEADGTAADMGYRLDRFGSKTGQTQEALFTEVTGGAAQLPEHSLVSLVDAGSGAKVDRLVRVVNGRETAVRLWRASGEFAATDVTVAAGLPLDLGNGLLAVGDFDNNGAQDVVSWNESGLRVFLSTAGVFKAQTVSAAMVAQAKTLWAQNAGELEVADLNGDGLLDLVCNYTVAGTARPGRIGAFLASGAADATGRRSWGTTGGFTEFREVQSYIWAKPVVSLADVNSDGLVDLLVLETDGRAPEDTGSRRPAHVYLNRWKTNTAAPFNEVFNHGVVGGNELSKFQVLDVNGDGKLDLVNGSAAEGTAEAKTPQWFEGAGDGTFTARTANFTVGAGVGHRLLSEVDADLDGVLDPVWLGADGARDVQVRLWRGKGAAALQDMTAEWGVDAGLGAGRLRLDGYFSDWDGDGSQDLVVRGWDDSSTQGVYKVYRNQAVSRGGKVVRVRLEGVRSPRDGQGAVIEVTAGGRKQIQYVGNLGEGYTVVKSFGIGTNATLEKITVRWPSGTVQELTKFGSSPLVEIKEAVVPVDSVVLLRLPQSVLAASGQAVSLSCEAIGIGAGTLTYQWFKDGVLLAGATKSSYDIASVGATHVGAYTLRLTFGTANVLTPPATVELAVPPTIVTQPQSVVLLPGQTARFSVAVSGTSPFTYQWFKGGSEIVGATNATLNVFDVGAGSVGAYTVKVTNGAGSVTSAVANLTLATAPAITVQPAGGMFRVGAAVVLTPTYTGTAPLRYQWYKDGISVAGGTAATLTLTPVSLTSAGAYTVTVTNAYGSADSAAAVVEVSSPPSIVEQPVGVSVLQGQAFKLQVRTALGAAQTFQWFKGTTAIAGATGTEFAVGVAQLTDAGSYFVRVTNLAGMVQSVTVVVSVNVPPSITTQPVALTLNEGSAGALSVVAQGSATLTYQWQKNGANIAGATAATYALKAATVADAGFYSVKVSNAFGTVQSSEVEVSVLAVPRITQQPAALNVAVDDRVSFLVVAEGSGTLTYQWRKGGVAIPNATSTTHAIAKASLTDAGTYDVVVSNAVGSVTSRPATLAVSAPPAIVTQPVGRTLNPGAALSLSVTATGTAPLTYQWSKDGQPITGATAATYAVASVQLGNAGVYTVVVSNAVGKATSQAVTVTVNAGVTITTQPASLSVNPGASASFSVSASGAAPLTYQWRKAGVNIPGATSSTYTIGAANAASVASYDVAVTNPVGTVLSAVAKLALNQPVVITTQPVGRTLGAGGTVELKVVATGTDPKTYQWSRNGAAIGSGTAATYTIASAQTADAGTYTVVVSNVVNSVTSAPAVVQLAEGVTITSQPSSLTLNPGTLAVFSVTATGGGTLTYQWRKNGSNIVGGTSPTYRIAAVKTTDAGTYTVVVANQAGSATSAPAQLAVNAPVAITTQPLGATITAGTPYTFRVVVTGTAPISYQWMKGGVNIAGATAATYTLDSPGSADSGAYSVKVSNMVNAVTSTVANLNVAGPPAITAQPVELKIVAGATGTLTAKVRSTLQFTYQWKKDGVAIAAGTLYTGQAGTTAASTTETTLSLRLLNASDLTPGSYSLTVTNAQGTASSTGAAVTVLFTKPKFLEVTLVKAARTFDLRSFPDQSGPTWSGLVPANETLRVTVLGEGTVTYAWRYTTTKASASGPVVLTSQTGPSLDLSQSGVNRGPGIYLCRATVGGVSTELKFIITSFAPAVAGSQVAALGAPLQIVSEPVSVSANAGGVVQLGVSVTAGKRSYFWFREGADGRSVLVGTGGTGFLRLDPLRASDSGKYFAVITDTEGNSVTSRPAQVTVMSSAD